MSGQSTRRCARCTRFLLLRNFRMVYRRTLTGRVGYRDSWCLDCRRDYSRQQKARAATERGGGVGALRAGVRHGSADHKSSDLSTGALTQDQVAAACGWTRGYVSQLEMSAFRKIRKRLSILFRRDLLRFPDSDLAAVLFRS